MSSPVDGAAPEVQDEFDRVWKMLDANTEALQGIETEMVKLARALGLRQQRIDKLAVDIERPTRAMGDYLPDPVRQQERGPIEEYLDKRSFDDHAALCAVREIMRDFKESVGTSWVSPEHGILLRIKAVIG